MHPLTTLPYAEIELHWDTPLAGPSEVRARQLRGVLARVFRDDDRFHQHDPAGRQIYRYPRVQYRWSGGRGLIIGWLDSAEILCHLPWLDLELNLGEDRVRVTDAHIRFHQAEFALSPRLLHYRFASPALLFNQDNYRQFQTLDPTARQYEQDRLLTAQLLTAMRGLDVEFPVQLYAALVAAHSHKCRYKQQELLGLSGRLLCNALLPPGFAIGHAVSHGYGWIEPVQPQEDDPWN